MSAHRSSKFTPTRIGICALFLATLGPAGLEKLLSPETPSWFVKQFTNSIFNVFEGSLTLQFYAIGVVELLAAVLFAATLVVRRDAMADRLFRAGLALSAAIFIALGLGQRLTHQFDGAASLFVYAAVTLFILWKTEQETWAHAPN